jgi:hypothetical protein
MGYFGRIAERLLGVYHGITKVHQAAELVFLALQAAASY